MSEVNRQWIAITFDNHNMLPILKVNGDKGLQKRINEVRGIKNIGIYFIDFSVPTSEMIGNIAWPAQIEKGDISILYKPEEKVGDVQIIGTSYIWSYDIHDAGKQNKTKKAVIDKEAVLKEMEKEENAAIYAEDLIEELNKDIFGQEEGVRLFSEILASEWGKKNSVLISILLMGPTGVGKTQLGKNLQAVLNKLTGKKWGLQIVPMNQYKESHSVSGIFGTTSGYVGYGDAALFDPSRNGACQIYLLNEFEKAHPQVIEALMEVFSEGEVKLGDNTRIVLRGNTIIIPTANLTVDMEKYNQATPFMKKEMCRDVLAAYYGRPEIAGKITHALAFQELSNDARLDIIKKFVNEELENYDIKLGHIDKGLAGELLCAMKESKYGARAIKDAVQTALRSYTAYKRNLEQFQGKTVELTGSMDCIHLGICA